MKWKKLGLVFCPDNHYPWMISHASYPVAKHLSEDKFRIYFSTRDANQASSITYLDIDINNPNKILNLPSKPVLSPGEKNSFDEHGCSMGCIINYKKQNYIYYMGWKLLNSGRWKNSIGLAYFDNTCAKVTRHPEPIISCDQFDPITLSYPWVIHRNGFWQMWYGSHLKWNASQSRAPFLHTIKYAESADGLHWTRNKRSILSFENVNEYAITRPCVLKANGHYQMWYTYRGKVNCIGYAESENGSHWQRKDYIVGIEKSKQGWDSEMIAYPSIFNHKGNYYMLYNGNYYGKTGFGIAILE